MDVDEEGGQTEAEIKEWSAEQKLEVLKNAYQRLEAQIDETQRRAELLDQDRKLMSDEIKELRSANEAMSDELEMACKALDGKDTPILDLCKPTNFKVILAGASSVGKTSLAYFFSHGKPNLDHNPTHGASFSKLSWKLKSKPITIDVWDTEGQYRGARALEPYLRGADAIIMVFDMGNLESLKEVQKRFPSILHSARTMDPVVFVLGNKADQGVRPAGFETMLRTMLEAIKQEITAWHSEVAASKSSVPPFLSYYEVSAKTGVNVPEVLQQLELQVSYRRVFGAVMTDQQRYNVQPAAQSSDLHGQDIPGCKCG
eukprot:gb/GEZN01010117.1/.p1 GENE.gb/GEZN01010117.1/~~gb/GEZN01010117.1/.p1  ORF type:complete len:315 (+),score=55.18 gb/GEZN01010117.1/:109-1053(+)